MKDETNLHNSRVSRKIWSCALMLTVASLISCTHKDRKSSPSPNPSGSPVTQTGSIDPATGAPPSPDRKLFKTGEVVPAGYFGIKVYGSWFTDHLSTKESGHFLFVDLSVVNTDRKERPVTSLKVIDETGSEYPLTAKAATVEKSAGQVGSIGAAVSKRMLAIFEVGQGHQYKLKAQGFSATDSVLIDLSPASTAP